MRKVKETKSVRIGGRWEPRGVWVCVEEHIFLQVLFLVTALNLSFPPCL